ncbi:hypothetical protein BDV96DRAFT_603889 [Lophiotrema nucula]|uniref:DUF6919 domain-containing protein n=1 Tax=Lophiotrema nucula TaxID=690887 RepID=A0A6A5YSW0_9PLEO|nr:hypothetical protein BDV96DRAFT_603889 [Lophiotrema nucula]
MNHDHHMKITLEAILPSHAARPVKCASCRTMLYTTQNDSGLCETCDEKHLNTLNFWTAAQKWEELVEMNRWFIRGDTTTAPYHIGRLWEETDPLIAQLLELHEYGFITIDSQPEMEHVSLSIAKKWHLIKQRAYLTCVLPTRHSLIPISKIDGLRTNLLARKDLLVTTYCDNTTYPTPKGQGLQDAIPLTPEYKHFTDVEKRIYTFRSTADKDKDVLTKWWEAKTRLELKQGRGKFTESRTFWANNTSRITKKGSILTGPDDGDFQAAAAMRPLVFHIAAREWDAGMEVVGMLVKMCKDMGFEKTFEKFEVELED